MKKFTMFAALAMAMVFALSSFAGEMPKLTSGNSMIYGGSANFAKASGDTVDLMGPAGVGTYVGDFESGWNGWTTLDVTAPTTTHWQVSNYAQAVGTNLAAWCGDIAIASCTGDSLDPVGGYGNDWHDLIGYRTAVANPGASATVTVTATLQHDSEPGYDYTYLSAKIEGTLGYTDLASWDGAGTAAVNSSITFLPTELVDGTDIYVLFRFKSDGGWSDGDCSWPTLAGACQVDDITVTTTQVGQADIVSFTDFQDGTFGDWAVSFPDGVGDFAALWSGLEDLDPCNTNYSQQVAFIDDGVVVPGTGGTACISWCYGPSGYIVNTLGGLAGPDSHLQSDIISPVMLWPNASYDGITLEFDVYRHLPLGSAGAGMFYTWGVRSADTDGSAGTVQVITDQTFVDRNFVYYSATPDYLRPFNQVTDLMNPGRDEVQVRLGVYELGYVWNWTGNNGTPAPYFDNVAVKVFPFFGPGISMRDLELAQDNFPEVDAINTGDLGSMHVRFDMANNISLPTHLRNDPGDSITLTVVPVRTGSVLAGAPEMHYTIDANPLFDPYRTTATSGVVAGTVVLNAQGIPVADKFAFDLPDTGTLFPGDVLHYYIRAGDDVAGDIQYATIPADISGFGDFSSPLAYSTTFTVHALPSISSDGFGGFNFAPTLFWNDFANRGGEQEWFGAFANIGMVAGEDYDIYHTNAPSSGVGNGIGGRTNGLALEFYDNLVYTSGDLSSFTVSPLDYEDDAGDDTGALLSWLSAGNKKIFMTGDNLAADLATHPDAAAQGFLTSVMGLSFTASNARPLIGNQTAPLVLAIPGNGVFTVNSWVAFGGCFQINAFDAVEAGAGATRLAEFGDPNNNPGAYTLSAATRYINPVNSNTVISMPYDLMFIYTDPNAKVNAPLSARAQVLEDVLASFGVSGAPEDVTAVPGLGAKFAVNNFPNPFNPSTKISYTIKAAGHLTLKVYNVRGELVKTLIDGNVTSSDFVMWDGTNNDGGNVSSGVYFYEARMGNDVQVNKMALVK